MQQEKSLEVFSTMPVGQAIFKNAVPSIAAMLMVLIYNLADSFFIGQTHDPYQLGAISLAAQVFVIYSAVGTIFGVGGTSVISRALGAGNHDYAKKVSSFCMWGSVIAGAVCSILLWVCMNPLLTVMGASVNTWNFTRSYLSIVALSGPCVVINGCFSNVLRAEGESTKAMMGQLLGNLCNIILDPIMISVFHWNTAGAAIATVIGNALGTIYYILYFYRGTSMLSIRLRDFTVRDHVCSRVLVIGVPASLNTLLMSISHMILNRMVANYGDLQLAGIGVATNIIKIPGLICIGLGQGIQPLVGYCAGSGDWPRCRKIIRYSLLSGFALSAAMMAFSYGFLRQLVGAFLTNADAFDYGMQFAKVMLITSFLFGVFYVLTNILQGFGAAKSSLLINISRQGLFYIPALFIMRAIGGMEGLVWSQPIADILAILLAITLYAINARNMEKKHQASLAAVKEQPEEIPHAESTLKTTTVITIGRSFGAGGRTVGKALAKALSVTYYDKELLEQAAKDSGISPAYLAAADEKNAADNSAVAFGTPMEKLVLEAQRKAILDIATKGACVIVGRGADRYLKGVCPLLRVFVSAAPESRAKRIAKRESISEKEALAKLKKVDQERAAFCNSLSDAKWGAAESYDLTVDTGVFGVQGAVEVILSALQQEQIRTR